MDSNSNASALIRIMPVFLIFLGLLGLYYLYQYLFGPKTDNAYSLITSTQTAQVDASKPISFTTTQLAPLYEGGEFTISTWIYVSNWSYRSGFNKSVLRIGGQTFDTIRIYLGAHKPKLYVRLHTQDQNVVNTVPGTGASNGIPLPPSVAGTKPTTGLTPDSLTAATRDMTYVNMQMEAGLLDDSHSCDLPEVPLQRWVNITVAVNGKTVDVYMDGKLARSCVLPNPFKVDARGYLGNALEYGGFGGQISTTTMYDSALNPEMVYKNYMAGPEPITSIGGLLGSVFAPNLHISVSTGSNS